MKKIVAGFFGLWFALVVGLLVVWAQESISLTTPIAGPPAIGVLRPAWMDFNVVTGTIVARLLVWTGTTYVQDGRAVECVYTATTTPTGASLIIALNKANMATTSLERRIMQQAATACPPSFPAGIPGTITGTPQ
jgi:hypothetical protein